MLIFSLKFLFWVSARKSVQLFFSCYPLLQNLYAPPV